MAVLYKNKNMPFQPQHKVYDSQAEQSHRDLYDIIKPCFGHKFEFLLYIVDIVVK